MSMLAELVDVVIGVDTHKHSHTAAVLDARTGAVRARARVATDPDGYADRARRASFRTPGLGTGGQRRLQRRSRPVSCRRR